MMGLALGVDYALLMVSRFREELAAGTSPLRGGAADAANGRAHHRLRRLDPAALDAGRPLHRARGAARLARRDAVDWSSPSASPSPTSRCRPLLVLLGPNVDRWRFGTRARRRGLALMRVRQRGPAPAGTGGDRDRRRRPLPRGAGAGAEDRPAQPRPAARRRPGAPGLRADRRAPPAAVSKRRSWSSPPTDGPITEPAAAGGAGPLAAADRGASGSADGGRAGPGAPRGGAAAAGRALLRIAGGGRQPARHVDQAQPQPRPRRGRGLGRCARASRKRPTAPACWPTAADRAADGAEPLARGLGRAEAGAEQALASLEGFAGRAPTPGPGPVPGRQSATLLHIGIAALTPSLRRNALRRRPAPAEVAERGCPDAARPAGERGERRTSTWRRRWRGWKR